MIKESSSKNVVIIGSALSGNKGAAAMLESSIHTLTKKNDQLKFTLLSMYPDEDRAQNTYKNLKILDARPLQLGVSINTLALLYRITPFLRGWLYRSSQVVRALSEADVLLDQGGITFVDGREKFLLYNIASILPALNMRVPVIKCAQALGTFNNPINKMMAKMFLPKMRVIVSRGDITQEYLNTLSLSNTIKGADYAFLLPNAKKEHDEALAKYGHYIPKGEGELVGIAPSVVMKKKVDASGLSYVDEIVKFIKYVNGKGYRVLIVPHSVRTGTDKTHNNDLPLCQDIYSQVESSMVGMVDRELSSQDLRYLIGESDYFLASRFHAMVSSIAMGVPTLVLGWSHKYKEVLDMFGLSKWAFGHAQLNERYLQKRFDELVSESSDVREAIRLNLPKVKRRSQKQVDAIVEVLEG